MRTRTLFGTSSRQLRRAIAPVLAFLLAPVPGVAQPVSWLYVAPQAQDESIGPEESAVIGARADVPFGRFGFGVQAEAGFGDTPNGRAITGLLGIRGCWINADSSIRPRLCVGGESETVTFADVRVQGLALAAGLVRPTIDLEVHGVAWMAGVRYADDDDEVGSSYAAARGRFDRGRLGVELEFREYSRGNQPGPDGTRVVLRLVVVKIGGPQ